MSTWLAEDMADKMVIADHRLQARNRGTWCHSRTGEWYELDYFLVSSMYVGRFSRLKTWGMGESDHAARGISYRLSKTPGTREPTKKKWGGMQARGFETSRLQDEEIKVKYQEAVSREIEGMTLWADRAAGIRKAAEEVLGRKAKQGADPIPDATQANIKEGFV